MDIKDTFLKLTDHLYPHGTRNDTRSAVKDFQERAKRIYGILPEGLQEDEYGNLYKVIGDGSTSVMFTSHLDTATQADGPVNHVFEDEFIKTDGETILGADDKAGTTIMMYMMEKKVPGLYYFFLAEEVGCLGSKWLGRKLENDNWKEKDLYKNINKVISFDRKGYTSVISFQNTRSASDKFCDELAKRLNKQDESFKYKTDPTGLYTDSARVSHVFPECTNISVGYFGHHTKSEKQNIEFLEKLCKACTKIDWETLPVERDPKKDNERKTYRSNYYGDDDWYGHGHYHGNRNSRSSWNRSGSRWGSSSNSNSNSSSNSPVYKTEYFHDAKYEHLIEINYKNDEIIGIDISQERVDFELSLIVEVFDILDIPYSKLVWDGVTLEVETEFNESEMTRQQLYEFLPELDYESQF